MTTVKAMSLALGWYRLRLDAGEKLAFLGAVGLLGLGACFTAAYLVSHYLGHHTDPMPAVGLCALGLGGLGAVMGLSAHRRVAALERRRP